MDLSTVRRRHSGSTPTCGPPAGGRSNPDRRRFWVDESRAGLGEETPDAEGAPDAMPSQVPAVIAKLRGLRVPERAKLALLVAAAGGHSAVFVGPPDVPTVDLIHCLPGLLRESTSIVTVSADTRDGSRDAVAAVRAAEVALVEDFAALPRPVLECFADLLRTTGRETQERARPPQLVAAARPCPCGFFGDPSRECTCSVRQWERYISRRHAAVLGAVDLHVHVAPLEPDERSLFPEAETLVPQVGPIRVPESRLGRPPRQIARLTDAETLVYARLSFGAHGVFETMVRHEPVPVSELLRRCRVALSLATLEKQSPVRARDLVSAYHWRRTWWAEPQATGWVSRIGATLRRVFGEQG